MTGCAVDGRDANRFKIVGPANRDGTDAPGKGAACAKTGSTESLWLPEGMENSRHLYS